MQNLLEKWGIFHINRYLEQPRHLFSSTKISTLASKATLLSFLVGFFITLVTASIDIIFLTQSGQTLLSIEWDLLLFIIVINIGMIAIEFWLLFHIGFQATARYIDALQGHRPLSLQMKHALVRAILEVDDPHPPLLGVNPHRYNGKHGWLLLLLYKLKVLLSNVIAKALISRLLSRSGLRSYAPLISTLITGLWDAWVQASSLKEVRLRLSVHLHNVQLLNKVERNVYSPQLQHALLRLIVVRLELFGRYSYVLNHLLVQWEKLSPHSVNDCDDLFSMQQLQQSYVELPDLEQQQLTEVACTLIALKRHPLNAAEKQLLTQLNLNAQQVKQRRLALNCPTTQQNNLATAPSCL